MVNMATALLVCAYAWRQRRQRRRRSATWRSYCKIIILGWERHAAMVYPVLLWNHDQLTPVKTRYLLTSNTFSQTSTRVCDVKYIWNNSYLNCGCRWKWRMIIPVHFQLKQLERRSLKKKIRASTGFEPAEVTGLNPVEVLIFFRLLLSNCLSWKLTAMIILHFHSCLYLSNRPQVSMGYRLINHAGCW